MKRERHGRACLVLLCLVGALGCHDVDRLKDVRVQDEVVCAPPESPPLPTEQPPEPPPQQTEQPPEPPPQQPPEQPQDVDTTPTDVPDGVPGPLPGVYRDQGPAPDTNIIRGLISFPIRNVEELERTIRDIYDPGSPRFRRYLTPQEWMDRHAPLEEDVRVVARWLESRGMQVPRIATNRLLLQFTGTVAQFNESFGAQLRILERKSPQGGNPPHDVYGLTTRIQAPQFIMARIAAVATADLPAEPGPMRPEQGTVSTQLPADITRGLTPQQVASAYGVAPLYQRGFRGQGVKLGVSLGGGFRLRDVRAFWQTFGVPRADPRIIQTMEPPAIRNREATLDVEWAGVMAPEAELVVYQGPDARNTSMVFTFNEAIARNEVSVITTSFAHREDSEPRAVHQAYGASAMMAAALGITVVAASGDSAGVDVPGSSPYVTAVGGTRLLMNGQHRVSETAWEFSGSGISTSAARPDWQAALPDTGGKRAVVDVALNADTGYWYTFLGVLSPNTGTSFSAPVFAGLISVVNGARASQGKPALGWLNGHLYTLPQVQATFRDITEDGTYRYAAGPGWDFPTGWGAPNAEGLLSTMP
jgi:kumamolisin